MVEEVYAPIIDTQMTLKDALFQVCHVSRAQNKLIRGTRQTIKKIMKKEALVVFLSEDSNKTVGDLIKALTAKYDIPLLPLEDSTELGKIVGFEKVKLGGETRVAKCSVACVIDYVRNSEGKVFLENTLRDMQARS